jgi:hypothetical protein
MLDPRWLMRARLWVRNPPSPARMKLVFGVIAAALVIVAMEHFGFWPDWATAQRLPRGL